MDEDLDGPPSARAWSGASVGDLPAGELRGSGDPFGRVGQVFSRRRETAAAQLEGRLDEHHEIRAPGDPKPLQLGYGIGQSEVAQIHCEELHGLSNELSAQMGDIRSFKVDDTRIEAESSQQLTHSGIDGVHTSRGPVEQRGREATRTRTDINRDTVGDRHTERVERVRQLHVTTKTLLSGDSQRRVGTNAGRRIGHHSAVDEYTTTLDDVRRHVTAPLGE